MQIRSFNIEGLLEITPAKITDDRGYFSEVFREHRFHEHVDGCHFVQENQSLNVRRGTVRGIHFQVRPSTQGKLVRCLAGSAFDVAVDLRHGSRSFGKWVSVTLSPEKNNQVWIPEGFGHGFCTLEPNTVIAYRVTSYYNPEHDKGLAWDDPDLGITWPPVADPDTLSFKDQRQPRLVDLPAYFACEDSSCA